MGTKVIREYVRDSKDTRGPEVTRPSNENPYTLCGLCVLSAPGAFPFHQIIFRNLYVSLTRT